MLGGDKGTLCRTGDIYRKPNGWRGSQDTLFWRMLVGKDVQRETSRSKETEKHRVYLGDSQLPSLAGTLGKQKGWVVRLETLARIRL